MKELSKLEPTLTICFREDDTLQSGWPPQDVHAYNFFKARRLNYTFMGEELAAVFLAALVSQIYDEITRSDHTTPWCLNDFQSLWAQGSRRENFFAAIIGRAEGRLKDLYDELKRQREAHLTKTPSPDEFKSHIGWFAWLYEHICLEPYEQLASVLKGLNFHRFFIAFDDCASLGVAHRSQPEEYMTLLALQRILQQTRENKSNIQFWYFFLDTTPIFSMRFPKGPLPTSFRLREPMSLLPPWLYLGFNQIVMKSHPMPLPSTAREALLLRSLTQFGRPYWATLDSDLVSTACRKLFAGHDFYPADINNVLAAFSYRIHIELGTDEESQKIAATAVSHHMRLLTGVALDNKLITEAPPEPILSIAAAHSLTQNGWDTYMTAFKTFVHKIVENGVAIEQGEQGELIVTLLLTAARDKALVDRPLHPPGSREGFVIENFERDSQRVRPVKLIDVLKGLIGNRVGNTFDRLVRFASDRWTNYICCIQLDYQLTTIPLRLLVLGWKLGAMFRCHRLQPVIDGFIVTYSGDLDQSFDPFKLGYVGWHATFREDAATPQLFHELTGPYIEYNIGENNMTTKMLEKKEHLVILIDFGAPRRFSDKHEEEEMAEADSDTEAVGDHICYRYRKASIANQSEQGKTSLPLETDIRRQFYAANQEDETERHVLWIRGYDQTTYPAFQTAYPSFDALVNWNKSICNAEFGGYDRGFAQSRDVVAWCEPDVAFSNGMAS
ncbi:hypothetical protein AX16_005876 [Volvariella volvacea WC 439]|nr:hypothetical protein AX16_005876 [Volvariella volvacea WC 439]